MNTEFFTFGEILWDCLPSGRHAGGAPFNVAAHIAQLGGSVWGCGSIEILRCESAASVCGSETDCRISRARRCAQAQP